ncbi:hypothetical protein JCGZ_22217 [Jatropha curcas]|uniref:Uncharacterized protein n=1 Tax=Jatropha curcas TaxID=180498 RepID=A0A067JQ81_JATCU|nr:hypothetical protein JCGZ_22217 [Jatropha curcas]
MIRSTSTTQVRSPVTPSLVSRSNIATTPNQHEGVGVKVLVEGVGGRGEGSDVVGYDGRGRGEVSTTNVTAAGRGRGEGSSTNVVAIGRGNGEAFVGDKGRAAALKRSYAGPTFASQAKRHVGP